MARQLTYGRKLGAGFAAVVALALGIGAVGIFALRNVVASKDSVIADTQLLVSAESLEGAVERKIGALRGFLLAREERYVERIKEARAEFLQIAERMERSPRVDAEGRDLLAAAVQAEAEHQQAVDSLVALRRTDVPIETVARAFDELSPKRAFMRKEISEFLAREQLLIEKARKRSSDTASAAITLLVAIASAAVLFATLLSYILTRTLSRQIATAVGQVQSSSTELQAAANQQATAAREQATAMNEITTTISELLTTSRQIAESSQRVAQIAGKTAGAAGSGEGTVDKAHESIASIRRQVDLVVGHMLELGKKSQQIGAVLEIVSELAEQTNILAINATIEAAGAGDTGKRFAVVADEIRKLADRVGGSTKEIRGLIEDVRSAVNTTVMATETGSKAVDGGSRQFGDVAAAFKEIATLVTTTTEAAREIELSTKQQTTAVEQVNVAIASVAQASKETEASSGQTLQTASQLAGLSKDLLRLVQPSAEA